MKKILYLLLLFPVSLFGQTQIVNVGATANDHTGDPIRTAFQKVNTNTYAVQDSFGNIYREPQTRSLINDSIEDRMSKAIDIEDYIDDFGGGGSNIKELHNEFIIGTTTGAPLAGDSTVTYPDLAGLVVNIFRDGDLQTKNLTATNAYDHFRFNSMTGEITVFPSWQDREQIIINAFQPVLRQDISLEGEESDLLTDLVAYYDMDESSGTTMIDAIGGLDPNNGVTTATVNQTGKLGKAYHYDTNTDDSYVPYDASLVLTGDEFTIAMWIKLDILPSVAGYNYYLAAFKTSDAYYWTHLFRINPATDCLMLSVYNTTYDLYEASTANSVFAINTWYHVAGVVNGTGNPLELYINGSEVSVVPDSFTGTFNPHTGDIWIGNSPTGNTGTLGYIDEIAIYNRALTVTEIQELMTKTYPFN